ncbi:MAG TPA: AAA family ATPase [Anaerolineaceae bacterium]|nr:AAA family ATPase [Anaerolineaceae bacterium]HPN51146.1 AAA family ATPase [Anaerolineaceae bacterium]
MAVLSDEIDKKLTPTARQVVETALNRQTEEKHASLGVHHWLWAMLQQYSTMMEAMGQGFSAEQANHTADAALKAGDIGPELSLESLIAQAGERAKARGRSTISERDLATIVLGAAGYKLSDPISALSKMGRSNGVPIPKAKVEPPTVDGVTPEGEGETPPLEETPTSTPVPSTGTPVSTPVETSRKKTATPTLDQYGRDLTRAAKEHKLVEIVGREEEVELVIETLCRRTKRNPVLVGPAGVGKTAIVEGLAQRIVDGQVPDMLKSFRLVSLQPSTLVAGASVSGELERRMKAIIKEAMQDGIILFIDEIHSAIGAGGMVGTNDIASILKPALARGEIACIAATTNDEYRKFIEPDTALERRFQPVRVQELSAEHTLRVLRKLRDELGAKHKITISDEILDWLLEFGQQFMRNRHFPDKGVDLLEQCFAYAVTHQKTDVDMNDAQTVAQRMIGMPVSLPKRLDNLKNRLMERATLSDEDVQSILNRLQVTMRGLDLRLARPNAVIMLAGDAAQNSALVAEIIAQSLFGAADRVVSIDFSRFGHPEDINLLIGAPPGYVGYSDALPIHKVMQIPWCVLHLQNIDICHPQVREVVTRALADGFITDGRGKVIYLSDSIVLMTAQLQIEKFRPIGFAASETRDQQDLFKAVEAVMGPEMAAQIDVVAVDTARSDSARRSWLEKHLLLDLSNRYLKQGIKLTWDSTVLDWLMTHKELDVNERNWERFVDEFLSPVIIPYLPTSDTTKEIRLVVKYEEENIKISTNNTPPTDSREE